MDRTTALRAAFTQQTLERDIRGLKARLFALAARGPSSRKNPLRGSLEAVLWDRLRRRDGLIACGAVPALTLACP